MFLYETKTKTYGELLFKYLFILRIQILKVFNSLDFNLHLTVIIKISISIISYLVLFSTPGLLWHGGRWRQFTKSFRENETTVIGIAYDGAQGTLTYYKDGDCLGVAFRGLNKVVSSGEDLYPIVTSTAAKTEMTLGMTLRGFDNLQVRRIILLLFNMFSYKIYVQSLKY